MEVASEHPRKSNRLTHKVKNKFCSVGVHFIARVDYSAENMPVFVKLPGLAVPHNRAPPTGAPGNHRRKSMGGGGAGDG